MKDPIKRGHNDDEDGTISALQRSKSFKKAINNSVIIEQITPIMASTSSASSGPPIPTQNRFAGLPNDVNLENNVNKCSNETNKQKIKISPLIVKEKMNNLYKIMRELKITKFNTKMQSVGIKVYCYQNDDVSKLKQHLIEKAINFYTFNESQNKPMKIVLSGLPIMPISEVIDGIKDEGVSSDIIKEVKLLNIKKPRYDDQAVYLVYLVRGSIKLSELRKIKYILHAVVQWNYHINRRKGPTQCRKCQMYGHGTTHCFMDKKCAHCSGDHDVTCCPKLHADADNKDFKCANCSEAHSSSNINCSKRIEYIKIIETNRSKNNKNHRLPQRLQQQQQLPPQLNQARDFPAMPTASLENTYFQQFKGIPRPTAPQIRRAAINQNQQQQQNKSSSEELFSLDEILNMVTEITTKLGSCTSRSQQAKIILEFSIKYIYNNNGST